MMESQKNLPRISHLLNGLILDLGCGPWPICQDAVAVDKHYYHSVKNPFLVCDIRELPYSNNSVDIVHSSHALEDLVDTEGALKEWIRVIKPGGLLILYLPHKDYYPNIGHKWANTDHKHDFVPDDIIEVLDKINETELIKSEVFSPPNGVYRFDHRDKDEYSFLIIVKKKG